MILEQIKRIKNYNSTKQFIIVCVDYRPNRTIFNLFNKSDDRLNKRSLYSFTKIILEDFISSVSILNKEEIDEINKLNVNDSLMILKEFPKVGNKEYRNILTEYIDPSLAIQIYKNNYNLYSLLNHKCIPSVETNHIKVFVKDKKLISHKTHIELVEKPNHTLITQDEIVDLKSLINNKIIQDYEFIR